MTADNEGEGYNIDNCGNRTVINLNYELAKTHFKKVTNTYESRLKLDYDFSANVGSTIREASSYLEKAGNVSVEAECASFSDKSLMGILWAGEKLALEIAEMDIEKYRKVNVIIKVVDQSRNPVGNAVVAVKQLDHDVMFACSMRDLDRWVSPEISKLFLKKFKEFQGRRRRQ